MNILFLTMSSNMQNIETKGIYTDLMRKFRDKGHEVYIVYPRERKLRLPTEVMHQQGVHLLGVKTLNVTKTNVLEKGIGQILLESQFKMALKQHFSEVRFDVILYSTPPITFTKVIKYTKKRNPKAMSYLLLKDIFPQNAIDLGLLSKGGVRGLLYRFFRKKEKELYRISDYIGCMSPANVRYVLEHNPEIDPAIVEIAPNSYEIDFCFESLDVASMENVRGKYGLPTDKPVFIYGGNMGKPQGIPFLIECMKAVKDREDCHFVIVGNGTEYPKLETFMREYQPQAVSLFNHLPKDEYDHLANACDVGMIFLDYRFTIPNYPSRLLAYLMEHMPIIAVTDPNCDTGQLAEENGYGFYCLSNSVESFVKVIDKMLTSDIQQMGENGYRFFLDNYTVDHTYKAIMKHIRE
ncbi:glycosyltransferase family 4 protein [Parabacteroides johnsonii]|uniref:glycosyltransferase family 4 protein n=1 Tax=Parabacteroides johnsonii TaxID=387661 RepID=UPI0022E5FF4A|nr:glycosyltransferase family 4 protein [Parabacteroides johnsonii]